MRRAAALVAAAATLVLPVATAHAHMTLATAHPSAGHSAGRGNRGTQPGVSTAPVITGTPVQGHVLSGTTGTWTNRPTSYAYQWGDVATCGKPGTAIPGATSSSYTLRASDVGYLVYLRVTATNTGGSTQDWAPCTAPVTPTSNSAPTNTAIPVISGTDVVGSTLSVTTGAWNGSPTSYDYQWQDCTGTCTDIGGATNSSYSLTSHDVGDSIAAIVTASNASGSASRASAETSTVTSAGGGTGGGTTGSCASAGTVWCGDFTTGNTSQYTEVFGQPASQFSFPSSPVVGLSHAMRVQMNSGDIWTDGTNRMQLRQAPWDQGQDLYFHVAVDIDPATSIDGSFSNPWRTLVAWPTSNNGSCSPLKLMMFGTSPGNSGAAPNGTPSLVMAGDVGSAPISCNSGDINQWVLPNPLQGGWYNFIVHIYFSIWNASDTASNPADQHGIFEFWMKAPGSNSYVKQTFNTGSLNGSQTYTGPTIEGTRSLSSHYNANLRVGDYRNKSFTTNDVIYYDGIRAVTSFAAAQ